MKADIWRGGEADIRRGGEADIRRGGEADIRRSGEAAEGMIRDKRRRHRNSLVGQRLHQWDMCVFTRTIPAATRESIKCEKILLSNNHNNIHLEL